MENPNLVYVVTVYGEKLKVNKEDLDNPKRTLIPVYNRFGVKIFDQKTFNFERDSGKAMLHKGNIAKVL